jgi:hypothetical protein
MYSLTSTKQTVFDGSITVPTHGLRICQKYRVYSVTGTSLIFINGITGNDDTNANHWLELAQGASAVFESDPGISKVEAKSATTSTLHASPIAYKVP